MSASDRTVTQRDATVTPTVTAYVDGELVEQRTAPEKVRKVSALDAPPERLERVAHRCGYVDEHGRECQTWTLHPFGCLRHRRQPEAVFGGDE